MVKKHILSINAPASWPVKRKKEMFLLRPLPGKNFQTAMPLGIILKDMLNLAGTTREAKKLLKEGKVLANKKKATEIKMPLGLMDVLELPDLKTSYRMLLNTRGKLTLHKIAEDEAALKPCKIINKTSLKGKKLQINLEGGANLVSDKKDYKVGDTIMLELPSMKASSHLKLEKGALVYITAGTNVGKVGTFEGTKSFKGGQPDNIVIKSKDGTIETRKEYALVIGHNGKSAISTE